MKTKILTVHNRIWKFLATASNVALVVVEILFVLALLIGGIAGGIFYLKERGKTERELTALRLYTSEMAVKVDRMYRAQEVRTPVYPEPGYMPAK